ncbi:hypothetical protein F4V57_08920 [Acinetobacter qingfengensis]|uniref:Uncharacterized protein n=1 Tax=Acinetobacter qingfengensis TaxID=1262585 RepID=A0A1E7R9U2_9GAMM|nr:hypothetical protein F4V57_08920 [Acinetobacter qingfengensis]OEY96149.1 hypothetical protein BJI46_12550 [Acinetobacter qingfengensis]
MANIFSKITSSVQQIYRHAEGFIEEERDFSISQNMLNSALQRYVTDNVGLLKDLHAEIDEDWLRLYATVDVAGIYAALSVDLKLVQMVINKKSQLIVFEQISPTQIIEARFDSKFKKWGTHAALFFFRKILGKDPLGPILQKYNIIDVKHGLLYLDLSRWLSKFDALRKFNINHGVLKPKELIVHANVNLAALLNRDKDDMLEIMAKDQQKDNIEEKKVDTDKLNTEKALPNQD